MVEMLPDCLSDSIKSHAEQKLFYEFQNTDTQEKYIILHSLGVSEHVNNVFGEIDFVILCKRGVLCVEVKGGAVERKSGIWTFTNRYGKTESKNIGPFEQVQGNMFSLRGYLKKRLGNQSPLVKCQYACCVIMPDCNFEYAGIDVIPEVLFDNTSYQGLEKLINPAFDYWSDLCYEKHDFRGTELTNTQITQLAGLLRGDFHFVPSIKEQIDRTTKALCELTDEQYIVMESLADNQRAFISGVAGSGKTLLAMEQARRAYWEGKSVLYLCYNHNIASYVKYHMEKEGIDIVVSTLHSFMMHQCGVEHCENMEENFFKQELPDMFIKKRDFTPFEYLIVDEGQDLLVPEYVECFEKMLQNGLQHGNWLIFYDPNQNIYQLNANIDRCITFLKNFSVVFRLSINCRNTKQIADANILLSGLFDQGRSKVAGLKVEYRTYSNRNTERVLIEKEIENLIEQGVPCNDIVVLSKYAHSNPENVFWNCNTINGKYNIKDSGQLWKAKRGEIRLATISTFKGLESRVVILCDLDKFSDAHIRLLNYVGASRAQSLLYIIYDEKAEAERQNVILESYQKI